MSVLQQQVLSDSNVSRSFCINAIISSSIPFERMCAGGIQRCNDWMQNGSSMSETSWLEYLTAIGSLATPVLVLALAGVGWSIRARFERRYALEDKLHEDRVGTYNEILEPFIIILTTDAAWKSDAKLKNKDKAAVAIQKLLSLAYRKQAFRLTLVGSDAVVKSYNELMQYFFQRSDETASTSDADVKEIMALLGDFLLEIRRSMGNEATSLDNWDMLEWFIVDARKFRKLADSA